MIKAHHTLSELQEASGFSREVLRAAITSGRLPAFQPSGHGGTIYICGEDFEAWRQASRLGVASVAAVPVYDDVVADLA